MLAQVQEQYRSLDSLYEDHWTDWVSKGDAYPRKDEIITGIVSRSANIDSHKACTQHSLVTSSACHRIRTVKTPMMMIGGLYAGCINDIDFYEAISHLGTRDIYQPSIGNRTSIINSIIPVLVNQLSAIKSPLEYAIEEANGLLKLPQNWDDEGARPISKDLFDSAVYFLRSYNDYLSKNEIALDIPEINPVPNGSIDLSWRAKNARMLINICYIDTVPSASFYGDLYDDKKSFKGTTPVSDFFEPLALWMKYLSA